MIRLEENELYQELAIYHGNIKIGEAEVEIKGKMLSRLVIYEPYQGKGYGTEVVRAAHPVRVIPQKSMQEIQRLKLFSRF